MQGVFLRVKYSKIWRVSGKAKAEGGSRHHFVMKTDV